MNVNELKAEVVRNGLKLEEVADGIKIARTTLWRRMANPDDFTLKEIKDISRLLNLSTERMSDIFFGNKVS